MSKQICFKTRQAAGSARSEVLPDMPGQHRQRSGKTRLPALYWDMQRTHYKASTELCGASAANYTTYQNDRQSAFMGLLAANYRKVNHEIIRKTEVRKNQS